MNCQNCGTKNTSEASSCINCGTKLMRGATRNRRSSSVSKKILKPKLIQTALLALLMIVLIVGGIFVLKKMTNKNIIASNVSLSKSFFYRK